jgi:uncharacterized membrane protein (DUF2068 family)
MTGADDQPRSRRVLRLIAIERILRGVLLLAAGVYLLFHLNTDFGRLSERVIRTIELDPRRPFLHNIVAYLHHLHASEIRVAAIIALGYGVLELVEGTGLWLDQLSAEYLTVIDGERAGTLAVRAVRRWHEMSDGLRSTKRPTSATG